MSRKGAEVNAKALLPPELIERIKKHYEGGGEEIQMGISNWDSCVFQDKWMVVPSNTAGSDDYHESSLAFVHNAKEVFGCEADFIAETTIYEKEDPDQPAFFVIANVSCWTGGPPYTIVQWD
jgi:hypothetical protein